MTQLRPRLLALLLLASPLAAQQASRADAARQALAGFDRFADSTLAAWKVVGAGIGIVVDGQVVYARGHGFRDLEKKLPATENTIFAIGSSSKAFTVFALGTLVDQGKLEWDKPLVTYLPDFRLYDASATMRLTPRDLVTHRSGLPRHDLVWYNNTSSTREELVHQLAYLQPNKDLRELFQYNNLMFLTAGYLAGRLMDCSWEDAIRKLVFQPLHMSATNFSVLESQKTADFSLGYAVRRDSTPRMPFRNIDLVGPAGSINSSVTDMLKWVGMHLAGGMVDGKPVINRATLRDMYAPHMPIGGMPTDPELGPGNYGMGWFVSSYRGHYNVYHGGNIDGFSALVSMYPQDRIGFVILSNQNGSQFPNLIVRHAMDRLLGPPLRNWSAEALARTRVSDSSSRTAERNKSMTRVPNTQPSHPLADYAADYWHPGYGTLSVQLANGQLVASYNGIRAALEHWHYDVFNGLRDPVDPTFADMKFGFRGNLKGNIESVEAPFEPTVAPIVFGRRPDRQLLDSGYIARFVGRYLMSGDTARVSQRGNTLVLTLPRQGGAVDLVGDRRNEFNLKGREGYSAEFVLDDRGAVSEARFKQPNGVFIARKLAP
jgi:CubicO group peptidase (beta-lactamase class C family)